MYNNLNIINIINYKINNGKLWIHIILILFLIVTNKITIKY